MELEIQLGETMQSALASDALENFNANMVLRTFAEAAKKASAEDLNFLTLDGIAILLGVRGCDSRIIECVNILIRANVIEPRAQYVDVRDDVYDFDQEGYKAALEAGAFIDPATGLEILDTSLLAPYWAVPESLSS